MCVCNDGDKAGGADDGVMGQLERRAETISGDLDSQNVANTLWAFGTMETKLGERMMGQLERRADAISGEFNSHITVSCLPPLSAVSEQRRRQSLLLP